MGGRGGGTLSERTSAYLSARGWKCAACIALSSTAFEYRSRPFAATNGGSGGSSSSSSSLFLFLVLLLLSSSSSSSSSTTGAGAGAGLRRFGRARRRPAGDGRARGRRSCRDGRARGGGRRDGRARGGGGGAERGRARLGSQPPAYGAGLPSSVAMYAMKYVILKTLCLWGQYFECIYRHGGIYAADGQFRRPIARASARSTEMDRSLRLAKVARAGAAGARCRVRRASWRRFLLGRARRGWSSSCPGCALPRCVSLCSLSSGDGAVARVVLHVAAHASARAR